MPAEGAAHRDSHDLLDLAPMTVGEDVWVMPHGVLASIPPRRTVLFGCPRRIPSRGGASAEFVVDVGGHQFRPAGGVCAPLLGGGGQADHVVGDREWTVHRRVFAKIRTEGV